jgi:C4-dicarboxylate transporter, DctM subunit
VAMMVILVCAAFTTLTGGSGVTIIALGGLVLPILVEEGYPADFSLGLVTAAGSLGLLFFPSLPVILYSVVAEVPAGQLYWSGLLPGLLLVLIVMAYGFVIGRRAETKRQKFSVSELRAATWEAKWELAVPVILLAAFISGKATIVEAAALATALAFVVEVFVFKDLHWPQQVLHVFSSAGRLMGAVIIVLGTAMGLTSYLVDAEIPARLLGWVTANVHSQMVFLLALNVILLVLGSVLEIYSAIVILAPLLVPMGLAFKVDPVHLGIIFLANLELGFLFPPVGLNLLLSSSRFKAPLPRVYRVTMPFLLILAVGVLVITYVPALTLRH